MGANWSKLLISAHLLSTFKPLLTLTFFFGLTPLAVVKIPNNPRLKRLRLCPLGIINAFIVIIIYTAVYTYSIYNSETFVGYFFKSKVSTIGDALQTMTGFVGIGLIYISSIIQQDKIVKLFHKFSEIGDRLQELGVKVLYKRTRKFFCSSFTIMQMLNLSYIIGSYFLAKIFMNGKNPAAYIMVGFFLQYNIVSSSILSFLCTANIIRNRFGFVNSILKNLSIKFKTSENGSAVIENKKKSRYFKSFSLQNITTKLPREIIQECIEVHFLLCEAALTANKYFTYQLLTIISISFLVIVFDAYYVLETCLGRIKRDENFRPVEFVTFFVFQMILYIVAVLSIVEGSVKAVNQSEETSGIIHALLNQAKDLDVREKLQNFSLQLIHQKVKFTAAGLFTIDRTLYFTITGAITTYLIILLQFST